VSRSAGRQENVGVRVQLGVVRAGYACHIARELDDDVLEASAGPQEWNCGFRVKAITRFG
jgi:hypothetical protein